MVTCCARFRLRVPTGGVGRILGPAVDELTPLGGWREYCESICGCIECTAACIVCTVVNDVVVTVKVDVSTPSTDTSNLSECTLFVTRQVQPNNVNVWLYLLQPLAAASSYSSLFSRCILYTIYRDVFFWIFSVFWRPQTFRYSFPAAARSRQHAPSAGFWHSTHRAPTSLSIA